MTFIEKNAAHAQQVSEPPKSKTERVNALKIGCAMLLSHCGFFPFFEVPLGSTQNLRADIYAINRKFETAVVEVKSSAEDFRSDRKWRNYLPYCSRFYFAADTETIKVIRDEVESENQAIGFITLKEWNSITPFSAQVIKPSSRLTWGVFSDPSFMLRLIKSNCLFIKGSYKGLRKVDKSLINRTCDLTYGITKTSLWNEDDDELPCS